ncbi:uncharacterized protein [Amphiura filiformis]|uniref:uncharacterized protein n=1 Tax=Amphiura filiformis TaxID=82378 RepID=UPI003B217400
MSGIYFSHKDIEESTKKMMKSTIADAWSSIDKNCDGSVDVTEYIQSGTLQDFVSLLKKSDRNNDSRLTPDEVDCIHLEVDPNVEYCMLVAMEEVNPTVNEEGIDGSEPVGVEIPDTPKTKIFRERK